jgi:8-oxo-dGTP pyrophosphatase MutT (NUDIX family)
MAEHPKTTIDGRGVVLQFAALPFRIASGAVEILLITSRETQRWIIPKGWPIRGLRPRDVAAREAFEEAGLVGTIVGKRSIGSYHYTKRLPDNQEILCRVKVFLLSVDHQLDTWKEKEQRECEWMTPQKAARLIDDRGLAELFRTALSAIRSLSAKEGKGRASRGDPTTVNDESRN